MKGSSLVGVFWGRFAQLEPEANRAHFATLTEWYESGDRITEVTYAAGVVIKFSTSSK